MMIPLDDLALTLFVMLLIIALVHRADRGAH